MGFGDWINEHKAEQQQSVAQNTQEEKPMHDPLDPSSQQAQEKARQTVEQMPPDQKERMDEIKSRMEKSTQHIDRQAPSSAPVDNGGGPEAMRQKAASQDKSAPALSPTSEQKGTPQKDAPSSEPAKQPESSPSQRPQTLPRRQPSWER
jgi:hypothetical protein